ncbi:hypothetical protein C1H46_026363 [Malus baccata]|uniref:Uncharacterized protein n=1 Tax=Malus baccata TaxID=106549 RepID=A0A540LNJ6_MALBA|nr:hypothetical protein C1H46_026363 [Malus baccata]
MAVFAVSGSVVVLAHQLHKRLLSDFMKNIESELGGFLSPHKRLASGGSEKVQTKKTVRFAEDVVEPSSNNKEYRKRRSGNNTKQAKKGSGNHKMEDNNSMPLNRQALYKGIIESQARKGTHVF